MTELALSSPELIDPFEGCVGVFGTSVTVVVRTSVVVVDFSSRQYVI